MEDKKDCKIVQDLFPNYIEKLTNDITNNYIEEHLNNCKECQKIIEDMKQTVEINTKKSDERKINGFKKYNSKLKKSRKILILMILALFLIFIIITARKMIIISNLCNLAKEYENSNNYHVTMYNYKDGKFYKDEIFKMDNKIKIESIMVDNGEITKTISIGERDENNNYEQYNVHQYIETENDKIVILDGRYGVVDAINNMFYTKDFSDLLQCAVNMSIKEKTIGDRKCYYINNFQTQVIGNRLDGMYIDKETGLEIYSNKHDSEEYAFETKYEFNMVTEDDFIEPDISDYKVMTMGEYIQTFSLDN